MARVLIVGCGCRGRGLAAGLLESGHAVRGTTREPGGVEAIEAVGAQAAVADPDRLSTLTPHLAGVSLLCWLMGTARGEPEAVTGLHGPRLGSLLDVLVDTPVRGVVYEAAGTVPIEHLEQGAEAVARAGRTHRMPVRVVRQEPADHPSWRVAMIRAVDEVLRA